jgi:hypothetical protein
MFGAMAQAIQEINCCALPQAAFGESFLGNKNLVGSDLCGIVGY